MSEKRIDITKPLWDQSTFYGRFRHFAFITNPLLSMASEKELYAAKDLYLKYKDGREPSGTTMDQVVRAKQLYESAFHPDSGELQNVFGRMSFQMPGGCLITGGMLQFYQTVKAVVFWQWVNQSFNALVNYTNRNAKSPLSTNQMAIAYVTATSAAMGTAMVFKKLQSRTKNPFLAVAKSTRKRIERIALLATESYFTFQRFVPFAAVVAANFVNIPMMRQSEIISGLEVMDKQGNVIGKSQLAPVKGITQVIISRIIICAPGMLMLPVIMNKIEPMPWMQRIKKAHVLVQSAIVGMFLVFMVPIGCATFPQRCRLSTDTIKQFETENYQEILRNTGGKPPKHVYFNKGL